MDVSGVVALSDTGVPLLSNLLAGDATLDEPARKPGGRLDCKLGGRLGCKVGGKLGGSSRLGGLLSGGMSVAALRWLDGVCCREPPPGGNGSAPLPLSSLGRGEFAVEGRPLAKEGVET